VRAGDAERPTAEELRRLVADAERRLVPQ
jgi:hypothetical protein